MTHFVLISAVGADRTGLVHELTKAVLDCGGNIVESRMATLGTEFATLMLVSGNWHTLAKLETELGSLDRQSNLSVVFRRTETMPTKESVLPYSVDLVALDQTGIVNSVSGFFGSRDIAIAEMATHCRPAPHTGANLFEMQIIVNIPNTIHIARLRDEFAEFCDDLNVDAILEPVKN
ncbi:MAG: glycine cleavage system protein R [Gammaproteobacteria bacterium]